MLPDKPGRETCFYGVRISLLKIQLWGTGLSGLGSVSLLGSGGSEGGLFGQAAFSGLVIFSCDAFLFISDTLNDKTEQWELSVEYNYLISLFSSLY